MDSPRCSGRKVQLLRFLNNAVNSQKQQVEENVYDLGVKYCRPEFCVENVKIR